MIRWPWVSLQSLNLDWIVARMKDLITSVNDFATHVTATFTTGYPGAVNVTGDLDSSLNFDFTIPPGPQGPEGPEGPQGPKGDSYKILGLVATTADLPSGASVGDAYAVGTSASNTTYVWDGAQWQNIGSSQALNVVAKNMTRASGFDATSIPKAIINQAADGRVTIYIQLAVQTDITASAPPICEFAWDSDIVYNSGYIGSGGIITKAKKTTSPQSDEIIRWSVSCNATRLQVQLVNDYNGTIPAGTSAILNYSFFPVIEP